MPALVRYVFFGQVVTCKSPLARICRHRLEVMPGHAFTDYSKAMVDMLADQQGCSHMVCRLQWQTPARQMLGQMA